MNFRKLSILFGLFVLVGSFFLYKRLTGMKEVKSFAGVKQGKLVKTVEVMNGAVEAKIPVTGRLMAKNRIELFAEVSGLYKEGARVFKEGVLFKKGEPMIRIDDGEAYNNLVAQRSNLQNLITQIIPDLKLDYPESFTAWDAYLKKFDPYAALRPLPVPTNDREKFFITSKNIYNQFYVIKSLEDRQSKYLIRAPFAGSVSESSITPGTLVRVGQKLGEFIDPSLYELETSVSVKDLQHIKIGDKVKLISTDISGEWWGEIGRINERIDAASQSVSVFIYVKGKGLKEGMFLSGSIKTGKIDNAFLLPRNFVNMADGSVYVVLDSVLKKNQVEVVRFSGDSAIVKGLNNGIMLLNENIPGAFEGMRVKTGTTARP